MPKLSDLLAEKAKADLQVGDATVDFSYFVFWRERFNDDEWTALMATTGRDYLKTIVPRVVQSWNLVDDDGHEIPVTAEAIEAHDIPTAFLFEIEHRALGGDLAGKVRSSSN